MTELGEADPNWDDEFLIDISTPQKRHLAATHVEQMVDGCADKGFDAVEFDNLDSWTRFEETTLAAQPPFGQSDAMAYATLITSYAHARDLAVAQKNTLDISGDVALKQIGFDFAVVEQCGQYDECTDFTATYGSNMVVIEYTDLGFENACAAVGDDVSVVLRNLFVTPPGYVDPDDMTDPDAWPVHLSYVYDEC